MIDLSKIKKEKQMKPPRIVLYGTPKVGKSTFASEAPSPVFIDIEKGADALEVSRVTISVYDDVIQAIGALVKQDHEFKTVVIDSVDWLEKLIHQKICKDYKASSIMDKDIKDLAYGRGYVLAANMMAVILGGLTKLRDDKNMIVIMIGHEHIKRYDDPITDGYDRYKLSMHDKTAALIQEWSDCLLFAKEKTYLKTDDSGIKDKKKGVSGGRVIYTQETPAYVAGNRYGLPAEIPLSWNKFMAALTEVMK